MTWNLNSRGDIWPDRANLEYKLKLFCTYCILQITLASVNEK